MEKTNYSIFFQAGVGKPPKLPALFWGNPDITESKCLAWRTDSKEKPGSPPPLMASGGTEERKMKDVLCPRAAAEHLAPSSVLPQGDWTTAAQGFTAFSVSAAVCAPVWHLGDSLPVASLASPQGALPGNPALPQFTYLWAQPPASSLKWHCRVQSFREYDPESLSVQCPYCSRRAVWKALPVLPLSFCATGVN